MLHKNCFCVKNLRFRRFCLFRVQSQASEVVKKDDKVEIGVRNGFGQEKEIAVGHKPTIRDLRIFRLKEDFDTISTTPWGSWINIASFFTLGAILSFKGYLFATGLALWPISGSMIKSIFLFNFL